MNQHAVYSGRLSVFWIGDVCINTNFYICDAVRFCGYLNNRYTNLV